MYTFDSPHVVIPVEDDFRSRLVHEYHVAEVGGHLGREKPFAALSRDFYWPLMYRWRRSCETCQRVKPSPLSQGPLRLFPIPTETWRTTSYSDYRQTTKVALAPW
ncbi:polyprotein [Phytophthora megakarya]|uniref:Polyprotein n=1 Tax=Phytophthora megakarya TaxID=4795 RepID=A0A225UMQ9_9STRA|nr:polyprotein [Phytophthora megakarya]